MSPDALVDFLTALARLRSTLANPTVQPEEHVPVRAGDLRLVLERIGRITRAYEDLHIALDDLLARPDDRAVRQHAERVCMRAGTLS